MRITSLQTNHFPSPLAGIFPTFPTDCPQRDERLGWTGDICVLREPPVFIWILQRF